LAKATKAKFLEAGRGHVRWLKRMGRPEVAVETVAVAVTS